MSAATSKAGTANAVETAIERSKSDRDLTWAELLEKGNLRTKKNDASVRSDALLPSGPKQQPKTRSNK